MAISIAERCHVEEAKLTCCLIFVGKWPSPTAHSSRILTGEKTTIIYLAVHMFPTFPTLAAYKILVSLICFVSLVIKFINSAT